MGNTIINTYVNDLASLNAAIATANQETLAGVYEIDFRANVELTAALTAINLHAGVTLDIEGNNATLNGANAQGVSDHQRGLFVYSGTVTINNLALYNLNAVGGSSNAGGGGAGLGGALFVANEVANGAAATGAVTLNNVTFAGDSATGGSGGVAGLGGGGGGLGGDGHSGGGGVGSGASGGLATEGAGGAGIVAGAGAAGNGDASSGPYQTAFGGADGGGGGGGAWLGFGPITGVGGGAGGGVGGASIVYNSTSNGTVDAAKGGFGGGGGGGGSHDLGHGYPVVYGAGGAGGFGGGGGAAAGGSALAGVGGFGGGGGADSSGGEAGGFGAGAGSTTVGGGGLGAGGDVFVEQGASLSIANSYVTQGGVTGGNGAINGSAFGSTIFLQGGQTLVLGAGQAGYQTTILFGSIADAAGFGGTGVGSVTVAGQGAVALVNASTFTGGVTLQSGLLTLGDAAAAGSGAITFAGTAELKLLMSGATLANPIAGFTTGDTLDFSGAAYSAAANLTYTHDPADDAGLVTVLTATGATLASFAVQGRYNVANFKLSADSSGSLLVGYKPGVAYPAPADFNGDGLSDILWRNANGALSFWGSTAGGFSGQAGPAIGTDWSVAGIGDFNGSGVEGVLWRNANGDLTTWNALASAPLDFAGNGGVTYHVGLDWQVAGVGDFNGDGAKDILWRNAGGAVEIWNAHSGSSPTAFDAAPALALGADWQVAGIGEFNGSGCDGILWRNANGDVTTWNSTGAAPESFAGNGGTTYHVGLDWQVAGVGDFNGDGHSDILWRNASGALQIWLESPGSRPVAFAAEALPAVGTDWQVADVGDFNGDGRSDIVWRNVNSGDVQLWLAQAGPTASFTAKDLGAVGADWQIVAKAS